MGAVKNIVMDIEEKIYDIEGLEERVGECEHISEFESFIFSKLRFEKGEFMHENITRETISDVARGIWNEFWEGYP